MLHQCEKQTLTSSRSHLGWSWCFLLQLEPIVVFDWLSLCWYWCWCLWLIVAHGLLIGNSWLCQTGYIMSIDKDIWGQYNFFFERQPSEWTKTASLKNSRAFGLMIDLEDGTTVVGGVDTSKSDSQVLDIEVLRWHCLVMLMLTMACLASGWKAGRLLEVFLCLLLLDLRLWWSCCAHTFVGLSGWMALENDDIKKCFAKQMNLISQTSCLASVGDRVYTVKVQFMSILY